MNKRPHGQTRDFAPGGLLAPKAAAKSSLGDRIITRANEGYHTRRDYPPFALTPWDDRIRWSAYIKTIADAIEAEDAK